MGIFSRIGGLISGSKAAAPETDQSSAEFQLAQATTQSTESGSASITLPPSISGAIVSQTFQSSAGARITLPTGTRVDKVIVFEGNLFFVQPDGSVVVILDGATQVPTLLVQGAEIPATALAETLQAAGENQIAAGPEAADSSGGNFAVPPGQIGPPLDLTPLLPPTALAFAIEINDPIAGLDDDGEAIEPVPVIGNPEMVALEEDDLPEGNDEDGSRPEFLMGMGSLDVRFGLDGPGSIRFSSAIEAPEGLSSNGQPIVYQLFNNNTLLVGFSDVDGDGVFTGDLPKEIAQQLEGEQLPPSTGPSPDLPVFVIEISQDFGANPSGKYTVWLLDNIDHGTPSKDGEDGTVAGLPATSNLTEEEFSQEFADQLNDEELAFLNFAFVARDGNGSTASSEFMVKVQDDIPEIHTENNMKWVSLHKGVRVDEIGQGEYPADASDLLYNITNHDSLHINISNAVQSAGYQNSLGYYFADENGNPLSGKIIDDFAGVPRGEDFSIWINSQDIPSEAKLLGFFIIPDGNRENWPDSQGDGTPVTFQLNEGLWEAHFVDPYGEPGEKITGNDNSANIYFSDRRLNPEGQDHEMMGMRGDDIDGRKDSNWEDLPIPNGRYGEPDFNDLQFDISVKAKVSFLLQVDEDDINNYDPYFKYYDHDGIEGSMGTSPNDGAYHDGSYTGHPISNDYGPAVAHGDLGIWWGSDDGNMEPSQPGRPSRDDDGTEFFTAGDGSINAADDTISFAGNGHDFDHLEKVVYTTTAPSDPGTYAAGLTPGVYYVIKNNDGTISLAQTLSAAQAGEVIDLTDDTGSGFQFIHKVGDRSLTFDPALDGAEATSHDGFALTSKSEQVIYQLVDDGTKLIAYVDGDGHHGYGKYRDNGDHPDGEFNPSDHAGDRLVFTVDLSDRDNGEVWFKLYDQIDHPDPGVGDMGQAIQDLLWLKFDYIATDSDGDMVMGQFTVDVKDDVPKLTGKDVWKVVDEDDIDTHLSHGNNADDGAYYDGSYTGNPYVENGDNPYYKEGPANVSGTVAHVVKFGADEPGMFTLTGNAARQFDKLGLSSQGKELSYEVQTQNLPYGQVITTLVAFVDHPSSNDGEFGSGDRLVFTFALNSKSGGFTFKLFDQLDHDKPFDDRGDYPRYGDDYPHADQNFDLQDSIYGDVRELDFGSIIKASDFDGDSITLDGKVHIKVRDDIPELVDGAMVMGVVEEEHANVQGDGNEEGKDGPPNQFLDDDVNGDPNITTHQAEGYLNSLVDVGADEPASFKLVKIPSQSAIDSGLTSKGQTVFLVSDGDVLTGVVQGGREVFTLEVQGNGKYIFTLKDQLDHSPGHGEMTPAAENLIVIDFSPFVRVSDFDHDTIKLAGGSFKIKVIDDVPIQLDGMSVDRVDEDDLNTFVLDNADVEGSLGTDAASNPSPNAPMASGSLASLVRVGADEPGAFSIRPFDSPRQTDFTSKGDAISYVAGAAPGVVLLVADFGGSDERQIGQFELDGAGNWKFTLFDQIDHPDPGVGNPGAPVEDVLTLDFSRLIKFTDFDGDSIILRANTLKVEVKDDVPLAKDDMDEADDTIIVSDGDNGTIQVAIGNVITGEGTTGGLNGPGSDMVGADEPGTITRIFLEDMSGPTNVPQDGSFSEWLELDHGRIRFDKDGNYQYEDLPIDLSDTMFHAFSFGNDSYLNGDGTLDIDNLMTDADASVSTINDAESQWLDSDAQGVTSAEENNSVRDRELGFRVNPPGPTNNETGTESLVVDLKQVVKSADVGIKLLFSGRFREDEVGNWEAFNADGESVGSGSFFGARDGMNDLTIAPGEGFQYIVFTASQQFAASGDRDGDNSDFAIADISAVPLRDDDDVVKYRLTDFDGDSSLATLTLKDGEGPDVIIPDPEKPDGPGLSKLNLTVYEAALDTTKDPDDLAAGNVTGTDPASPNETNTGAFKIAAGSDDVVALSFGNLGAIKVVNAGMNEITGIIWGTNPDGQLVGKLGGETAIVIALEDDSGNPLTLPITANTMQTVTVKATLTDAFPHSEPDNDQIMIQDLMVMVVDEDGDMDMAEVMVTVHDDVPEAADDMDMVVEGGDGNGMLNMTTGNVITGVDNDPDPNNGSLLADNVGADKPGTITQVVHNGVTYDVNQEFETELGGKFTIDENGNYKYTAPSSALHKKVTIDVTFGRDAAGFDNTMGYVVLDDAGNPTVGQIMFASSDDSNSGDSFTTMITGITEKQIAFFLIPNGHSNGNNGNEPGYINGADVTFDMNGGQWVAELNGEPLGGTGAPAYFFIPKGDATTLNPDNIEHVEDLNIGFGWEDLFNGGDRDFNDFEFDFSLTHQLLDVVNEDFVYTLQDDDGDTDTATLTIDVKDTEPVAINDQDMVVEGTTNDEPNTATGNVVFGDDIDVNPDANNMDGNADILNADGFHAICEIVHDGVTYTLDHDVLTADPSDSPFTFADGKLTITTALGGQLEIQMTGADAGDYTYTAPDQAAHISIEDGIAIDDPQLGFGLGTAALEALFDETMISAFKANGDAGEFSSKNVNFTLGGIQYKYSGLGVKRGGDNGELDFRPNAGSEKIVVDLKGAETTVYVGIGALFGGENAAFDRPFTEQLRWVAKDSGGNDVGTGVVDGVPDGLVRFEISGIGEFHSIELTALDDGAGNNGRNSDFLLQFVHGEHLSELDEVFNYTIADGDWDKSEATLTVTVKDTEPTANDDFNSVLEGESVMGNVVTGAGQPTGADIVGEDTDGAAIYKLSHGGQVYTLANTDSSGKLTITTELGGTLEIQMTGPDFGKYTYTAPPNHPHSQDALTLDLTNSSVQSTAGVWIKAFNIDGSDGILSFDSNWGMGVKNTSGEFNPANNGNSAVPNQLNHAPDYDDGVGDPGSSESIEIMLHDGACGFSFEYTRAIQGEGGGGSNGGEIGRWTAFDEAGNEIGTGLFGQPETVTSGRGVGNVTVDEDDLSGIVSKVVFTALPYAAGDTNPNDSSDYFIREFTATPQVHESFEYMLTDGDWDVDAAILNIKVTDDMPIVMQGDCIHVYEGAIPNIGSGNDVTNAGSGFVNWASGMLGIDSFGADGFGEFTWNIATIADADGNALESMGQELTYTLHDNGETVIARMGNWKVFELEAHIDENDADASYFKFTLTDPVDNEQDWDGPGLPEKVNIDFTLKDDDGSTKTGQVMVKIHDDAPTAEDDMDMTLEGGMTLGNVITGVDPDDIDPSIVEHNQGDLQADEVGADYLHPAITHVMHDGETYEVGPDGYVEFTTDLGGTFRIEKDGDYKYTAPDSLDHGEFHVTTDNIPSFITIAALNEDGSDGSWSVVTNSPIPGPGFGVDGNGDDEIDIVDNAGANDPSETLIFSLAPGMMVQTAMVDLAKLFPNEGGVGNEQGRWEAYNDGVLVGGATFSAIASSGERSLNIDIPGGFDELRFTATNGSEDTDGGDSSDYTVQSIWFGRPMYIEDFKYTLEDGDGSHDDSVLSIKVKDDSPTIQVGNVFVDEDGLPAGVGDMAAGDAAATMASASGTIAINFGADGPDATSELVITLDSVDTADPALGPIVLTSDGFPVATAWNDATNTLTGTANGSSVFTLVVNGDGTYDFSLLQNLDHPSTDSDGNNDGNPQSGYEDDLVLNFTAMVTDADGSMDSDSFTVTVDDDMPVVGEPEAISVSEAGVLSTAAADTTYNVVLDGESYTLFIPEGASQFLVSGGSLVGQQPLTLTLLADIAGATNIQSTGNFSKDDPNPFINAQANLIVSVGGTDTGGNYKFVFDNASKANDFAALAQMAEDDGLLNELFQDFGRVSATGNLDIDWGADDTDTFTNGFNQDDVSGTPGDRSVVFTDTATPSNNVVDGNGIPLALSADGQPLSYSLNSDATILTASANGQRVFQVQLEDDGSGEYRFIQEIALDHPAAGPDTIAIGFTFKATDSDGDMAFATFTVTVNDDVPSLQVGNVVVDEDGLPAGVGDMASGDAPATSASATGTIAIDFGADGPDGTSELVVTLNSIETADPALGPLALTSDGFPIATAWSDATNTLTGTANGSSVFTLVVNGDGTYDFTLLRNLDHPSTDSDGNNDGNPQSGFEDDLVLNLTATVKDGDGDTASADFTITIDDDIPVIGAPESITTSDAGLLSTAAQDTTYNVVLDGESYTLFIAEGASQFIVSGGDLVGEQPLTLNLLADIAGATGVSTGNFSADDPSPNITVVGSGLVTRLSGNGTGGQYRFTFDDPANATNFDLFLEQVKVDGLLNELFQDFARASQTGELNIDWGADNADTFTNNFDQDTASGTPGDRSVTFADTTTPGNNILDNSGSPLALSSGGDPIVYSLNSDATILTASAGGQRVFQVQLEDDGTGQYRFTQEGVLDHPNSGADSLDLNFAFKATDSDGDMALHTFKVTVDDDVPYVNVRTTGETLATLNLDETTDTPDRAAMGETTDNNSLVDQPSATTGIGSLTTVAGALAGLFDVSSMNAGADGEASSSIQFSLTLADNTGTPQASLLSNLSVTDPTDAYADDQIYLFLQSGDINGRVGNDAGGDIAFTLSLSADTDLANAALTVEQFLAIEHGDTSLHDEEAVFSSDVQIGVELAKSITDNDGDSASDSESVNITGSIAFDDDGPKIIGDMVMESVDEAELPTGDASLAAIKLVGAKVAVFDNGSFVDTNGTNSGNESDTIQASISSLGHTVSAFIDITESGFATALAGQDVLVIPEQERGVIGPALSPGAIDTIREFVADGGSLVIAGRFGADSNFLNTVFGFSTSSSSVSSSSLTGDASGTQFSDDSSSIPSHSATQAITTSSLPIGSLNIYGDASSSTVAVMPFGQGQVTFVGWDWFNAAPLGIRDSGWLQVLDSAISKTSITTIEISATLDLSGRVDFGTDGFGGFALKDPTADGTATPQVTGVLGDPPATVNLTSDGVPVLYTGYDVAPDGTTTLTATAGGEVVFTVEVTKAGAVTYTQFEQINQAGQDGNPLKIDIGYNAFDGDGDSVMDAFQIKVIGDDIVTITDLTAEADGGDAVVDEDGLPTRTGEPAGSAGPDMSKTMDTETFTIDAPDGVGTLTIGGTTLISGGVFTPAMITTLAGNTLDILSFDAGSGVVTYKYTLNDNQPHPNAGGENDLFENIAIFVQDTDDDTASATLSIRIIDDVPSITMTIISGAMIVVDETDGETATGEVDPVGGNLGATTISAANLFSQTVVPGADDVGAATYSLSISSENAATGLVDTASGQAVVLVTDGPVIEGRTAGDGDVVFEISVSASGDVTVTQLRAVEHDNPGDFDESGSPEMLTAAAETLLLTGLVVDGDGDVAMDFIDLSSGVIKFEDDGPTLTVTGNQDLANTALATEVDETLDASGDRYNAAISEVEDAGGNANTDDTGTGLGQVTTAVTNGIVAGLFTIGGSHGADGQGAPDSGNLTFAFSGGGSGPLTTNLSATDGGAISLTLESGDLVGRDTSNQIVFTVEIVGPAGNEQLLTTLFEAIDHGSDGNAFDSELSLQTTGSDIVQLQYEVTRTDGDNDSITVADQIDLISSSTSLFLFDDDGPKLVANAMVMDTVEEEQAEVQGDGNEDETATPDDDGDNGGNFDVTDHIAAGNLNSLVDFGSDGAGTGGGFALSAATTAEAIALVQALNLTSNQVSVDDAVLSGSTITARTSGADARDIFSIDVAANGTYTFTLLDQIDHHAINAADNIEDTDSIDLSSFVTAIDGDGDSIGLGDDSFLVKVVDDIPVVGATEMQVLDEADFAPVIVGPDATPQPIAGEFRVNTETNNDQYYPGVTALKDGGFVVSWWSYNNQGGNGWDIYIQRYDNDGTAQGVETRVNSFLSGDQRFPTITALDDGGFVVLWQSPNQPGGSGWDIYGQRYDSNGIAQGGEFRVNSYINSTQEVPAATGLEDGGFIVTWSSYSQTGSWDVYGQRYNENGGTQGGEFRINSTTGNTQIRVSVSGLEDGGFVAAWMGYNQAGGQHYDVYFQKYNANGIAQGSETRANTTVQDYQYNPSISGLSDGGFVVTWMGWNQAGGNSWDVFGRVYDADGNAIGSEFRANSHISSQQEQPSVAALDDGGFIVTWNSYQQDGNSWEQYGQRFDANGLPVGSEFRINETVSGHQYNDGWTGSELVAQLSSGDLVTVWRGEPYVSGTEVYARLFSVPTTFAPLVATGTLDFNYGADEQGMVVMLTNVAGLTDQSLTTGGIDLEYVVTGDATDGYVLTATAGPGGITVFTLELDTDGNYTFTLFKQIDHPGGGDDVLPVDLSSMVAIIDADGDTVFLPTGHFSMKITDDVPVAVNDTDAITTLAEKVVQGNVIAGTSENGTGQADDFGNDGPDSGGGVVGVEAGATGVAAMTGVGATITGLYGDLVLTASGDYSYTLTANSIPPGAVDSFTYTIADADGDTSFAILIVDVPQINGLVVGENVSDVGPDTNTPDHFIDTVNPGAGGDINGGLGEDLLIGDVGGGSTIPTNANIILLLDVSGSMSSQIAFDHDNDPGTPNQFIPRLEAMKLAVNGLLDELATSPGAENVRVHMVAFSTGRTLVGSGTYDVRTAGAEQTATLNAATAAVTALTQGGWTNYESALQGGIDWVNAGGPNGPLTTGNVVNQTFFLSDGEPTAFINGNNTVGPVTTGSGAPAPLALDHAQGEVGTTDNVDEIAVLESIFGPTEAIGIALSNPNSIDNLDEVEDEPRSSDASDNISSANELIAVLSELNPIKDLQAVGDDNINGSGGNDLIFGDAPFTDDLAAAEGLTGLDEGAGWDVFTALEAGGGNGTQDPSGGGAGAWTRGDTIEYILNNASDLARESLDSSGNPRAGGNDIINGGAGDDTIFGMEGNDTIMGGSGNDSQYGGSGADTFVIDELNVNDLIADYESGDFIDLTALFDLPSSGGAPDTANIGDYVNYAPGSGILSVDASGSGTFGSGEEAVTVDTSGGSAPASVTIIVDDGAGNNASLVV